VGADLIAVVDAAYRFDVPDSAWLEGVVRAIRPFVDQGFGVWSFILDGHAFVAGELRYEHPTAVGLPDNWRDGLAATLAITSRDSRVMYETMFGTPQHTMSELLRRHPRVLRAATRAIAIPGVRDSIGISARDSSGWGVFIGAHAPAIIQLGHRARARYGRLVAHIATAFRLRQRLADGDLVSGAEAILAPNARVEHAVGAASTRRALDALREAARAADRAARRARGGDPDEALRAWEALVACRWSLVTWLDDGGRRLLVARPNAPAPFAVEPRLTRRERQVAGYLLLGHSYKLIAYELGLSSGTIGALVSRIRTKLGATSAAGLNRRLARAQQRWLAQGAPEGPGDAHE
jgi:DNA-binding CsgD family transcriptional regulator